MALEIRKTLLQVETTLIEGGKAAPVPLKLYSAIAVIKNPWAGHGFVEDLKPEIHAAAPVLGALLTKMIIDAVGSGDMVEAYGKSAVVGLDGEIEHASALIHTLRFGNHYRQAVGAKSYLAFCNTRGPANAPVMIPLMDKNDEGRRSHYLTIQTSVPDAPAAGEILIALGASVGGRPHHRIGDRYQDLKDLGNDDVNNPAAV
ncbi:amino acid synthesis family protein [Pararhizobium gei]|uniref:amino acid synthesis family protein n=1 Tax=Pararhizobium gei TaxID=1395951 RepID=UPI0023DB3221|nr:amino acid synthesis family protein [Rhizobium gei]